MKKSLFVAFATIIIILPAQADIVAELGANFVSGSSTQSGMLLLQKRWNDKYAVGIGYVASQDLDTCGRPDCQWEIDDQFMVGAERLFAWRKLSFGFGIYWFNDKHRISSTHLNVRLSLEFAITDRLSAKASHFSNGGTGSEITICSEIKCLTDKFNPGQDSLMLVWRF